MSTTIHVMPRPEIYKASAVWVTAHNWAAAAERRWGQAFFWVGDRCFDPQDAMLYANRGADRRSSPPKRRSILLRTLAKDARWLREDLRYRARDLSKQIDLTDVTYIWQHHDLFLRGGHRLGRLVGAPVVSFVDSLIVWESSKWGVKRPGWGPLLETTGEIPSLRAADVIACVSQEVADAVESKGVSASKIIITPCTAEPELFAATPQQRQSVRGELGLKGRFVVGWTGSFRRFHALDTLMEAFSLLACEANEARLMLVGGGPERDRIEALACQLGVRDRVLFVGSIPHDQMARYLAAMDAGVLTADPRAQFHYSPLKLREYLAASLPVLAPNVGEPARLLSDGRDAMLYPPGESAALARQLLFLRSNARLRYDIGRAGRTLQERTGTMSVNLSRLERALVG